MKILAYLFMLCGALYATDTTNSVSTITMNASTAADAKHADDASQSVDDGMPFGKITDNDTDQLMQFAKERGFDLNSELQKAYAKDVGTNALGRIFRFSLTFKNLDKNARTYGQMIYSSLLNLGETMGVEQYSSVVDAQSPEVRQRIRDFLYFPTTRAPEKERVQVDKEVRADFPKLFPKDYAFGQDDPLFKK
jgi:hypothetical protein